MDLSNFTTQELMELKAANDSGKLDGVSQNTLLKMKAANNNAMANQQGMDVGNQAQMPQPGMMDQMKNGAGRALLASIPPLGAGQMYDDVKQGLQQGPESIQNTPPDYGRIGSTARNFGHGAFGPLYDYSLAGTKYASDAINPNKDANFLQAIQDVKNERTSDQSKYPISANGAQMAGLLIPGGLASKTFAATNGAISNPYLANSLGGVATGQMMMDPNSSLKDRTVEAGKDAFWSTLFTGAGKLLDKATPVIKRWGENSVMSWLKGADRPLAQDLLKDGVAPSLTMDSALKKMALKSQEATSKIDTLLPNAPEGAKIDMGHFVEEESPEIGKIITEAKNNNDPTTVKAIRDFLYKDTPDQGIVAIANKGFISPQEAEQLKRSLWSGGFGPNDSAALTQVKQHIADALSDKISGAVPGYAKLNQTQKTAIGLMKSAKVFDNGSNDIGFAKKVGTMLFGGPMGMYQMGKQMLGTTAVKTGLGGMLNKASNVLEKSGSLDVGNQLTQIMTGTKPPEAPKNSQQAE